MTTRGAVLDVMAATIGHAAAEVMLQTYDREVRAEEFRGPCGGVCRTCGSSLIVGRVTLGHPDSFHHGDGIT